MEEIYILTTAFLVGLSGAMAPGPLTAVTVEHTIKKGFKAGPLITFGHGAMELVVVLLFAGGLGSYFASERVGGVIGIIGSLVLFWMGYNMLFGIRSGTMKIDMEKEVGTDYQKEYNEGWQGSEHEAVAKASPQASSSGFVKGFMNDTVMAGTLATVTNPYWFIWWTTVGAGYITFSLQYGAKGLALFFGGHLLADLAWLSFLSLAFASGKRFITGKVYQGIMVLLSIFIIGIGGYFLYSGINFIQGG